MWNQVIKILLPVNNQESSPGIKEIEIDKIKKYFESYGLPVDTRIRDDPKTESVVIEIRPRLIGTLRLTYESIEHDEDNKLIKSLSKSLAKDMVSQLLGFLRIGELKVVPSREIKDYLVIYNPDNISLEKILPLMVALEI